MAKKWCEAAGVLLLSVCAFGCGSDASTVASPAGSLGADDSAVARLIERAKSLELDTSYGGPSGDPLEYHAAGFAKVLCSAVFISGLSPDFAAENLGYA